MSEVSAKIVPWFLSCLATFNFKFESALTEASHVLLNGAWYETFFPCPSAFCASLKVLQPTRKEKQMEIIKARIILKKKLLMINKYTIILPLKYDYFNIILIFLVLYLANQSMLA